MTLTIGVGDRVEHCSFHLVHDQLNPQPQYGGSAPDNFNNIQTPLAEKAMAPHSSTLAWKIPWMEETGRLQSMGSRRVRHD